MSMFDRTNRLSYLSCNVGALPKKRILEISFVTGFAGIVRLKDIKYAGSSLRHS